MKTQLRFLFALGMILCASAASAGQPVYDSRGNLIEGATDTSAEEQNLVPATGSYGEEQTPSKKTMPNAAPVTESDVYGGFGFGGALTGDAFDASYASGFGGEAFVGFRFDHNWSLVLNLDYFEFDSSFSGFVADQLDLTAAIRYTLGKGFIQPYLFAGGGMSDNLQDQGGTWVNGTGPSLTSGIGFDLMVSPDVVIYLQGKWNVNYNLSGDISYFPLTAGVQFN